jgi:hypothetical protein
MSHGKRAATSGRPIVVSDVRFERGPDEWTLSCAVDAAGLGVPERFFYTVERVPADEVDVSASAFVPPLLLLAAYNSRELIIRAPVAEALLEHIPAVLALWNQWDPRAARIDVTAMSHRPGRRASAAASFFSGGVDSFYSVVSTDSRYSSTDPRSIRFLVFCHGFDIRLEDRGRHEYVRAHLERAATDLGKVLVSARTNARDFVRCVDWAHHGYGPCLGGLGVALSAIADTVYLPAAYAYQQIHAEGANASHPFVDPLWSAESVDIVHSGGEATRAQKIACLSRSPVALAHLRVCWQNVEGAYNCCRCEKCLRTMAELEMCGVLGRMKAFPLPLTAEVLRSLSIQPHLFGFWQEWLDRARRANLDTSLCEAVDQALSRGRFQHSPSGQAVRSFVRRLSAMGLTPSRLKHLDRALLQGRGVSTFRYLRSRLRS